jgi:NADP-dependent 3-hydroxy acid dehydrogenase YdfG
MVFVNNVVVSTVGALGFEDIEQWEWVIDLNVLGMLLM